ncbi:putative manganese-dependent inorganic pyrophosphatase [Aquisphaera giovannonii]|uniref:Putative manganese-dependent inorganic pyrophosphatase n=1 Tax=Aquisphaera giovannonii TaxID=406548 RepID=A0A5B9W9R3_9BACT|nr:DHH family phosphoesterase [Aquisphaera giovannonii]QEH37293.1 putative manganese-dependent inorganic pyrophosphatase [Aquisphaera giovannonii]
MTDSESDAKARGAPDQPARVVRSERVLAVLAPFRRIAVVSHVNPDPDSLASMLGLKALIEAAQPGKPVLLTVEGMIARAENRAMVELIPVPLVPVESVTIDPDTAVIMVDSQPRTGRRGSEEALPQVVIDHHETGGDLTGVLFRDIRTHMGATSTMVTGYLIEQKVLVPPELATALLYGIESETTGYPREATSLDDGALVWLFPRANKDLLARIRNPRLPHSHFATFQHALSNAFLYRDLIVSWCGEVTQPDIIAEVADFFIRFDRVHWALAIGLFERHLKLSLRASGLGDRAGEVLREVVDGIGSAGGHDKRAGGMVRQECDDAASVDSLLKTLRHRLLERLEIDEQQGQRLLNGCPEIPAP